MSFSDAIRIGASGASDFEIQRSLKFDGDTSLAFLEETAGTPTNNKIWTYSVWVKRTRYTSDQALLVGFSNGGSFDQILFSASGGRDQNLFMQFNNSGTYGQFTSTRKFKDSGAWGHLVIKADTTAGTNGVTVYWNNEVVAGTWNVTLAQDATFHSLNQSGDKFRIGHLDSGVAGHYLNAYLAEATFIDGQALNPSSFAELDATTGQWNPIDTSGLTFGNNGFRLTFENNDLFTNFTDSSSSQHIVTRNGNVIHKSDQTKNGATSIYFDGSGDTLTVPDSTDFTVGSGDFTIEAYIRRTSQGSDEWFFVQSTGTTASTSIGLHIGSSSSGYANRPSFRYTEGSTGNELQGTTTLAANTWYHIAGVRQSNTVRIYVNGVQENSASYSGTINDSSAPVVIGAVNSGGSAGFTGHMDQLRWSNSVRYPDGTSFTAPTTQFTADSNTKLLVQSNVTGDVGSDSSGNDNNFTETNFSVYDAVKDTPLNNFCTINSIKGASSAGGSVTYTEGNLKVVTPVSGNGNSAGTLSAETGKWYAEIYIVSFQSLDRSSVIATGIAHQTTQGANAGEGSGATAYLDVGYFHNGMMYINATENGSYGASYTTGDIIGVALDLDNRTVNFYKNNSAQGAVSIASFGEWTIGVGDGSGGGGTTFALNYGQESSFLGNKIAQGNTDDNGNGDFFYTPPSGFLALCTKNLPDPAINLPKQHFNILLYTGNDSNSRDITGVGFQPDWLWIKNRSQGDWHMLQDSVRGANKNLYSNETDNEQTNNSNGYVNSFLADGFNVNAGAQGNVNENNENYVAWNWNAGNTDGKTYTVTVVDDSGNKYRFDGFAANAVTLDLAEGGTYIFNYPSAHPFRFSTTSDGTHGGGSEYTTGVTVLSSTSVQIVVAASAPQLHYFCTIHSGMGGAINTNSTLGSSNFDGSVQATVKANPTAGFSIVIHSGSGNRTVGHGLGVAPQLIFTRGRNVGDQWTVGHHKLDMSSSNVPWNYGLPLNTNGARQTNSTFWNNTAPTSSVFTRGSWNAGYNMIAYCFTEIKGFSKFGFFRGNGSADGQMILTGFRPAYLIVRRHDSGNNWRTFDATRSPFNTVDDRLYADTGNSESTGSDVDFVSNGFKMRQTDSGMNASGGKYIFIAFAEAPLKFSRAR